MDFEDRFDNPIETIQDLLKADPKARDDKERTALIRYVLNLENKAEVLLQLIGNKEHLDAQDIHGRTALHYSFILSEFETMAVLIEHGADVTIADDCRQNLLHLAPALEVTVLSKFAIHDKNVKLFFDNLKRVLDGGADVNQIDERQQTPLMIISQKDNWKIAQLYIQYGADVNYCRELNSETCLHSAATLGESNRRLWDIPSAEIIIGLILNGADLNRLDKKKDSPLGRLLRSNHDKKHLIAREYIKYGVLVHWRETIDFKVSDRRLPGRLRIESDLKKIKSDCDEEIGRMRRYFLTENFNLCQFAINGFQQVAEEARTEVCVEVCNHLLRRTCPIYHDLIYSRLEVLYMRKTIMELQFNLKPMNEEIILVPDITFLMSAYLHIDDMFNILEASILKMTES